MTSTRAACTTMQIFLYEYVTGGGLLSTAMAPQGSLLREGIAMVTALAEDLAAVEDVEVAMLWDHRLPPAKLPRVRVVGVASAIEERAAFRRLGAESDWTVVIAPEFDHVLLDRCREMEAAGRRLLGPRASLVQLASDKHATAEYLRAAGRPVPRGVALERGERLPIDFPYPAVLKPRDGAGSQGVQFVRTARDMPRVTWPARLEEFCPGQPASVALLGGPRGPLALEPCRQHLSQDGRFTYQGGSLPLPPTEAQRARRLAEQVAAALPHFIGYVGIDLILGPAADGSLDRVIEVNPRLTTSYVGLRAAAKQNLAAVMLDLASDAPRMKNTWLTGVVTANLANCPSPQPSPQRGEGDVDRALVTYRREVIVAGIVFDADGHVEMGAYELARA